jgi:ribosomal protein S21
MSVNAEVTKTGGESALATIRKFTRRVQGAGTVKIVRGRRYYERDKSKTVKKKRALKLLKRRADYHRAIKDGKIQEPTRQQNYTREPSPFNKLGEGTPIAR